VTGITSKEYRADRVYLESRQAHKPLKEIRMSRVKQLLFGKLQALVLIPIIGALCWLQPGAASETASERILFDAHSHLFEAGSDVDLAFFYGMAGVGKVLLFPGYSRSAEEWHLYRARLERLRELLQEQIYLGTDIPIDSATNQLALSSTTVDRIRSDLVSGDYVAIGELTPRHRAFGTETPVDHPILLKIYRLVSSTNQNTQINVPVIIHVEQEFISELRSALYKNLNTTFIWAHAGDADPASVFRLMKLHSNLWIDISCRNPLYVRHPPMEEQSLTLDDDEKTLKPDWQRVFETFSDRVLFGSDLGPPERYEQAAEMIKYYQHVLDQLPDETAQKIASGNITRLLRLDD